MVSQYNNNLPTTMGEVGLILALLFIFRFLITLDRGCMDNSEHDVFEDMMEDFKWEWFDEEETL